MSIFSIITLLLRFFKLYDGLMDFIDTERKLEAEKKRVALEQAVDDTSKVKTSEDAFATQDRIVSNKP